MIDAAVVIPIYRANDGELHIIMILRNSGGVHGGQVAFPGGKRDQADETMLDTALREVHEELGLVIDRAHVLAELPVTQTRTTGYRVFPYLARISVPDRWQVDPREVAEIIDVRSPRQDDRSLSNLAKGRAGFVLPRRFPSSLWPVLPDTPTGAAASRGGRLGCLIAHL